MSDEFDVQVKWLAHGPDRPVNALPQDEVLHILPDGEVFTTGPVSLPDPDES